MGTQDEAWGLFYAFVGPERAPPHAALYLIPKPE
jgi:hypothetical protein